MDNFEALLEVDRSSTSVRGPPCFIPSGDKVMVEVQWTNPGVARLTQSIKYITPFLLELPWIGVETEVCDFLDDGKGCQDNAQVRIKIMKIFFLVIKQINFSKGKDKHVKVSNKCVGILSYR